MKTAIIIPARYGSTRFPGKPLALIKGRSMLSMVVDVARIAAKDFKNVSIFVTTEDDRIAAHAKEIGVNCVITSPDCPTGSDRALEAVQKSGETFDVVINRQGDAPFTPPGVISKMIAALEHDTNIEVVTPVRQLKWTELEKLAESKKTTPFSGTTVIVAENGRAIWFSKNIIPGIRAADKMKQTSEQSPVFQHIGLYGFRVSALEKFCALPQSRYEQLEGLEQLRLLENNIAVYTVTVDEPVHSGIDSPEDLARAQNL
jgi:3-deoxy-manno-octulosonate cytidylyltransferase (CMP-KDO synthetase)